MKSAQIVVNMIDHVDSDDNCSYLDATLFAQYIDAVAVSSTQIRNALMEGDVKKANRMLGYEYSITGIVVEGNKIGRIGGNRIFW